MWYLGLSLDENLLEISYSIIAFKNLLLEIPEWEGIVDGVRIDLAVVHDALVYRKLIDFLVEEKPEKYV